MSDYEFLHAEESLHELKGLRKDVQDSKSVNEALAKVMASIPMVKGDKGDTGVSIKSVKGDEKNDALILTIEKTDGSTHEVTIPRIKGIDGKDGYSPVKGKDYFDGKDGAPGKPGKDGVGKQGLRGKAGADGKDGKGIKWRGLWNANTLYAVNDAVHYLGSSYIVTKAVKGEVPMISKSFDLMALKGQDGRNGTNNGGNGNSNGGGVGASALEDLTDTMEIATAADKQLLKYDETEDKWRPGTINWGELNGDIATQTDVSDLITSTIADTKIGDLLDTETGTATDGQVLTYVEADDNWVAADAPAGGGSGSTGIDGGHPDTVYGGLEIIDGGVA